MAATLGQFDFMQIDIDEEMAKRPISNREKIAVFVLLLIFQFILPAKYSHQVDKLCNEIKQWL